MTRSSTLACSLVALAALCGSPARADVSIESSPEGRAARAAQAFFASTAAGLFRCKETSGGFYRLERLAPALRGELPKELSVAVARLAPRMHKGMPVGEGKALDLASGKTFVLCLVSKEGADGKASWELSERSLWDGYLSSVGPDAFGILERGGARVDDVDKSEPYATLKTLARLEGKAEQRAPAIALLSHCADTSGDQALTKRALQAFGALTPKLRAEALTQTLVESSGRAFDASFAAKPRLELYRVGPGLAELLLDRKLQEQDLSKILAGAEATLKVERAKGEAVRSVLAAWVVAALGKGEPYKRALELLTGYFDSSDRDRRETTRALQVLGNRDVDRALRKRIQAPVPRSVGNAVDRRTVDRAEQAIAYLSKRPTTPRDVKHLIPWVERAAAPHNAGFTRAAQAAVVLLERLTLKHHGVRGAKKTYETWAAWWHNEGSKQPMYR